MSDSQPRSDSSQGASRSRRASGLRGTANRLADVRPGEGAVVLSSALSLAGIVAAHVALETARDAIFLTTLGPHHLAFVYLAMAALAALVGRFELFVERVLGRTNSLILSLMLTAMGTTLFYVADKSDALTFALYLWTGLSGTLLLLQFWLFAATRFDGAQGRRLYGLIAAGGVLGAVVGGALSSVFARFFDVESLLAVAAFIQLLTALLITAAPAAKSVPDTSPVPSLKSSLQALAETPYLRRIVLLTAIATITLLSTDYLFKSVATERIPGKEDLGRFLATYYMSMNAIALVIQLFIAVRVLQRAGTIFTLTLLPFALLLASGAPFLLGGVLGAALLAKGADGALRHSLHKVSTELLFLPLTPVQRASAKGLIDSLVTRSAQGIAALGLLGLSALNLDTPRVLFGVIGGGSLVWIIVALSLRRPYIDQFRNSIGTERGAPDLDLNQLTLDGVEVVVESLSSTDEQRVLSAMALFERAGRTGLIPALMLYHPQESIILKSLELIPSKERKDWPALAERLVDHDSEKVRLAAVRTLGRFGYLEKLKPESFKHPRVIATAAFFQADHLSRPEENANIAALLESTASPGAQAALLETVSEYGSTRWAEVLLRLQNVTESELARLLPKAMIRVRDKRFTSALISRLTIHDGNAEVRQALAAIGSDAFLALKEKLLAPDTPDEIRLRIPRALCQFQNQQAADFLVECLHRDLPGAVRYKALLGLSSLAENRRIRFSRERILPLVELNGRENLRNTLLACLIEADLEEASAPASLSGTLLVELLGDKKKQSAERVTRLLQLLHRREDLKRVYHAIVGRDRIARSAAGELLEVITLGYDESLREVVRTMSDALPARSNVEHIMDVLDTHIESSVDALRDILSDPDPPLSAIGADYAQKREVLEVAVEVQEVLATNPWLNSDGPGFPSQYPPRNSGQ